MYVHIIVKYISTIFSSCKSETLPIKQQPPSILPYNPGYPHSVSMNVITLDMSYKWNQTVFVFLWLTYFA